jgi:hypothetical protein
MRKKSTADDTIVTISILHEELKKTLKFFPTREEMNEEFMKSEARMDEKARLYRDQILTKLDEVMGELAQGREDRLFLDHDVRILKETSAEHAERITALENRREKSH